jgi:hypothetical protein
MPEKELQGYVSVNLRLALMKADHPNAEVIFDVVAAEDSGIHPVFRGDTKWFVTCSIEAPGMTPIKSWKEVPKTVVRWVGGQKKNVPAELNPEFLVKLQTMAAGRALKQMGYPDSITDLKPLLLWRRRMRELDLLAGMRAPELEAGEPPEGDEALDAIAGAARPSPEAADDDVEDAEVIEDDEGPPAPDRRDPRQPGAEARPPGAAPPSGQSRLDDVDADAEWVAQAKR